MDSRPTIGPPPTSMVDLLVRCSEDELIDLRAALVQRRFRLKVELEQIEQALAQKQDEEPRGL